MPVRVAVIAAVLVAALPAAAAVAARAGGGPPVTTHAKRTVAPSPPAPASSWPAALVPPVSSRPAGPASSSPAPSPARGRYRAPVDAPVVDPFRRPRCRWCPGNRGLEYATTPGTTVRSAATGIVTFTGSVAGALDVTIAHPDGLRTTYAFLAGAVVVAGQRVGAGEAIGTAGPRFLFTVRDGDSYLDPAALLAGGVVRAHLVPLPP